MFWNDIKEAAEEKKPRKKSGPIPIESLQRMSCEVCPRDKLKLDTPKMPPEGVDNPSVYLLATQPTEKDDRRGESWSSDEPREVASKLSTKLFNRTRSGYIAQCHDEALPDEHVIECCRLRVESDIERTKPSIVAGVGNEALKWATGLSGGVVPFRGSLIATKIGKHACWYFPILEPKYINKKRYGEPSEFERAIDFDCQTLHELVFDTLQPPTIYEAPYDTGIEYIEGDGAGDMVRLEETFHRLLKLDEFALDIETSGLSPYMEKQPKIWTAAIGTYEHTTAFPISHPDGWGSELRMRKVEGMFGDFIVQSKRKICHHAGFEMEWLSFLYGVQILRRTEWEDTMAMAYSFDEREGTKSLDVQCRIHFGFHLKAQSRVDVSKPNWIRDHTLREVLRYNGLDTKWTHKLRRYYALAYLFGKDRERAIYERKIQLAPGLVMLTERGLPIDFDYAKKLSDDMKQKADEIEAKIRRTPEVQEFTRRFGPYSPGNNDQVLQLMRDVLKRPEIEVIENDGTVKYSTGEKLLESMPPVEVPSAQLTLDYRGITRNETTYLGPLLNGKLTGPDDRLHASYSAMQTVTSRWNSPMHNWPKHKFTEVRGVWQAPDRHWIVACDEGQIEFRMAMMLSGDEKGIEYCWTGYDCHGYWAQRMLDEYPQIVDSIVAEYKIDWDEKGKKTLRQHTKNGWVFPMLFGSRAKGCAYRMHIPLDVAERLAAEFWDEFKGVKRWQERTIKDYQKNLYVETKGGFRRHGTMTQEELINMPIQGTTSELVEAAFNEISEQADIEEDPSLHPVFHGHDDLSFIVHDRDLERHISTIAHAMCKPRWNWINVPLIVEVSIGERWNGLKEIAKYSSADLYHLTNPYR